MPTFPHTRLFCNYLNLALQFIYLCLLIWGEYGGEFIVFLPPLILRQGPVWNQIWKRTLQCLFQLQFSHLWWRNCLGGNSNSVLCRNFYWQKETIPILTNFLKSQSLLLKQLLFLPIHYKTFHLGFLGGVTPYWWWPLLTGIRKAHHHDLLITDVRLVAVLLLYTSDYHLQDHRI